MQAVLSERHRRLATIFEASQCSNQFPLMKEMAFAPSLSDTLAHATLLYLLSSLRLSHPKKEFVISEDFLSRYREPILELINRTPNGKVNPLRENALEFNMIEKTVEQIFKSLNIDDQADLMQFPVSLRVQDGTPDVDVEDRPYATSKIHSDIWTGEPADCAAVIIPVMGDLANSGLDFFEPQFKRVEDFAKVYQDYLDTIPFTTTAQAYGCNLKLSHLYVFDSFCLHKTVKNNGGLRISVDFRFTYKKKIASDALVDSFRAEKYVSLADWYTIDKHTIAMPTQTADATRSQFKNTNSTELKQTSETNFDTINLNIVS
ncbi:MAG: hypothetical protein ACI9CF_000960 [Candidatus Omnitrophota bacterium]|jgi:hypothetical protein